MGVGFEGRTVLVTGGASGIGRAASEQFAAAGASVVIADLADAGDVVGRICRGGGAATYVHADVSSEHDVAKAVDSAVETFGGLDAAFNNAGIAGPRTPFSEVPLDVWQRIIDVDLTSVFLCMRAEVRAMIDRGLGGAIVNTASMAAISPRPGAPHYAAAKHGVLGLTQSVAAELAGAGIRVNAICPGGTDTAMLRSAMGGDAGVADRWSDRRLATPEEVAAAAVWLCSDAASFVSGVGLAVDGANLFL